MERQYNRWNNLRDVKESVVDSFYSIVDNVESTLFALTLVPVAIYGAARMLVDVNRQVLARVSKPSKLEE